MPKKVKELTAIEVKRLVIPGFHSVGTVPGLALQVTDAGSRSWVLRTTIGTRRRDVGLGGYPGVTLAMAHESARVVIAEVKAGIDPVLRRREVRDHIEWTFETCATAYIVSHRAGWKNAKHAQQWTNTLVTYAYPLIGKKHIKDITKADVIRVIEPHWLTKNETINRVRNRIELVIDWAVARELRPDGRNPASWKANLDQSLPAPSKVAKTVNHPAVHIDEAHSAMERIKSSQGVGSLCLQFVILTAARTSEGTSATWNEIDLTGKTWTIPAAKMKGGRVHRVPLSQAAIDLLISVPRFTGSDLIFPGLKITNPLSDMTLTSILRRLKIMAAPVDDHPARVATTHGFRSTFGDWVVERTTFGQSLAMASIAHKVVNDSDGAYLRGTLFDKRREVMTAWAGFLATPPANNVLQFKSATA